MEGDADEQRYRPGQHRGLAQSPLQKREQQVQKQDAAEEPLAHTGKVCSDPARGNGKVVEPQKRQHQRDGPGPAEAAGVRHKPIAEHYEPREPEQRVDSPRAPFVKLRWVLLRRDGQRQRCAGHNEKQRGAEISQINAQRKRAGKELVRQCKIPRDRRVEMHDQDADQRCGTDKIKIKQALLFDGWSPLLLLQSVLDEPPQLLGYSGRLSGGGLILI